MKLIGGNSADRSSSLNIKIWLIVLMYEYFKDAYLNFGCKNFANAVELAIKQAEDNFLRSDESRQLGRDESDLHGNNDQFSTKNSRPCEYYKYQKRLICNGSLDLPFLSLYRGKEITSLVVEKYAMNSEFHQSYRATEYSNNTKWYLKFPSVYQKLAGQIQLKNTELRINIIVNFVPKKNCINRYLVSGEAFSNNLVKISRSVKGELFVNDVKNRTVVAINVKTSDFLAQWDLQTNLTLLKSDSNYDEWIAHGTIKSDIISEDKIAFFIGFLKTEPAGEECKFSGKVNLHNANLVWNLKGSVNSPQSKQATIPRGAFSNMSIQNVVFKKSNFFNDFDKDVFEGLRGVESVFFLGSKLEGMPKLSELFQSMTDLKNIYIEHCTTPNLNFGTITNLEKVRKVSFEGSGPLNFNKMSFYWLQNSSLTYLNLKNCYIIISPTSDSVLQNVSKTLKYLDISRSNLKNEADLSAILYHLNIIYLAAEDLQLKKIPTNALAHVKYTLRYLSLRKSDFGKVLEKNMFNLIFNFPLMTELIELNLMECKINYLERGAFDSLPNLKILHLGKNNLVNLQDGWVLISPKISHLDLSWNGLAPQLSHLEMNTMGTALNLSIFTELKVLNLSNGIFINTKEIIESLGSNLQYLSLTNIDLKDFSDTIFQKLTDLEALDLSFNKNLKSIHMFSVNLFQHLKNLKTLILKGCRINTGSVYKGKDSKNVKNNTGILTGIKYLDLSYNNIREMDLTMFQLFPKLEVLKLTGNGITTWKTSLFNFGKNLKAIYLDENKIETMTPQMISDVKKLRRVKFGNNPFICDAYVYDVLRIAEHKFHRINEYKESLTSACLYDAGMDALEIISPGTSFKEDSFNTSLCNEDVNDRNSTLKNNNKTIILDWSENNYHCFSHAKGKFLPFTLVKDSFNNAYDSMRKEINGFVIYWLPVATVFGLVLTIGIVCWKLLDVHLITAAVRNAVALSFLSRGNKESEKYEYNVFVSYSDKDRPWVIDCLIPRLESQEEIKVCLHERDFQVGLSILENIVVSIDNSSNIILVLSKSFLKSHWCQYEMHLAQHRLLEKGRDQLILILLEDIPLIKRPKILRYLMMTKTYLEWPNSKNSKDIELFWTRLLKSLKC